MSDFPAQKPVDLKAQNLIPRFCLGAILITSVTAIGMSILFYNQIRYQALGANLEQFADQINAQSLANLNRLTLQGSPDDKISNWRFVEGLTGVEGVAEFNRSMQKIWASETQIDLNFKERIAFTKLLNDDLKSIVIDNHKPRLNSIRAFFGDPSASIAGLIAIHDKSGGVSGVLKVERQYQYVLLGAEKAIYRIVWYLIAGSLFFFAILFYDFWRGLKTIDRQERQLNEQISRLSKLLSINKGMQRSMKTASSRAVELNEQFLRRVGSDLHDGPAQSIGYAVLRLDRITKEAISKELSQEFHVVKEALDNALAEIRGISSGLVLPELEQLSMLECFKTVVGRHAENSGTEVRQYYKNLPDVVPLPIKICAYRFVQEGLNNAHRHGQAKKCLVAAYVKDDVLHLSLKDNGMGFRKSQLKSEGGHLGLMGLKDRIESLGGRFSINSELGVGTAIKVSISFRDEEDQRQSGRWSQPTRF